MTLSREDARKTLELILEKAIGIAQSAGREKPQAYLSKTILQKRELSLQENQEKITSEREGEYWLGLIDRNPKAGTEHLRTYVFIYKAGNYLFKSTSWPLKGSEVDLELVKNCFFNTFK